MSVIVMTYKPLTSLSSGHDLRVWHLCRTLADAGQRLGLIELPLAMDEADEFADQSFDLSEIFEHRRMLDSSTIGHASVLRHLRWSEASFLRLAYPQLVREALQAVSRMGRELDTRRVIIFGAHLAGIAAQLKGFRVLLDVCDSVVLTMERVLELKAVQGNRPGPKARLQLARWRRAEGRLPREVELVTTINAADSARVRELSGGASNVSTLPNGIAPELEAWLPREPRQSRDVVFWGNLSFGPNLNAIRYFYEQIYAPKLTGRDIGLCVVGRNPPAWLRDHAASDDRIRLCGFVPDLFPLVSDYPVMINPMVSGSGMKNKVLEAFAVGCAVVSTSLGMEAIEGAEANRHFACGDSPSEFADRTIELLDQPGMRREMSAAAHRLVINRYTWAKVGCQWVDLVESL